jgi:hypothetical protein
MTTSLPQLHTIHICTMTPSQKEYEDALRDWFTHHGYRLLACSQDPLSTKLQAARSCDLCLLLLGQEFGPQAPLSSFSHTELEASTACDGTSGRLFVIVQNEVADPARLPSGIVPEQRDFIRRMLFFATGSFANICPLLKDLPNFLPKIIESWRPLMSNAPMQPQVRHDAIMISSTGAMKDERKIVSQELQQVGFPIIDYKIALSEPITPRDWVVESAQQCRAVFLIMGPDYASDIPFEGLGATELEFESALGASVPIYAFLRSDAPIPEMHLAGTNPDQAQFVERVLAYLPKDRVFFFHKEKEPHESILADQVHEALHKLKRLHSTGSLPTIAVPTLQRWYRRRIQRWMGTLVHLTRKEDIPLEQIFVSLKTLPEKLEIPRETENRKEDIYADIEKSQDNQKELPKFIEVDEALKLYPRLVLRGSSGSGKSVILRWYAINTSHEVTPIFIRLASYARAREERRVNSLIEFIAVEEHRLMLTDGSLWQNALQSGRAIILFDALDEVPQLQQVAVRNDIQSMVNQLPSSTHTVVTTRPDRSIPTLASPFVITEVLPLDPFQQLQLVEQWLIVAYGSTYDQQKKARETANHLMDLLQQETNLSSWAHTPLMLTLLAAIAYASEGIFEDFPLTKAAVFRRALRLMLAQWSGIDQRNSGGQHLWSKEQLLIAMAQQSISTKRHTIWTRDEIRQACSSLSGEEFFSIEALLSELSQKDGLLPQIGEQERGKPVYTFQHPMFQEYLEAAWVAEQSPSQQINQIVQHRLDGQWEETTQLLVSELDRLGCAADADKIVQTLMEADTYPVQRHKWKDPLHLALLRAAHCQGIRVKAKEGPGRDLAEKWIDILFEALSYQSHHRYLLKIAGQALVALGPASIYAESALRVALRTNGDAQIYALEALGQFKNQELVNDLCMMLKQRTGEACKLAAKVLTLLGPAAETAREDLHIIVRMDIDKEASLAAAEALIAMGPTLEELELIRYINERGYVLAMRASTLLVPEEALELLREGLSLTISRFDKAFRTDARLEAIRAIGRLGVSAEPLVEGLLNVALRDIERLQKAAEGVLFSLGSIVYPAIEKQLEGALYYTGQMHLTDLYEGVTSCIAEFALIKMTPDIKSLDIVQKALFYLRKAWACIDEKPQEESKPLTDVGDLLSNLPHARSREQRGYYYRQIGKQGSQVTPLKEAVEVLRTAIRDETEYELRHDAIRAVGRIGPLAASALDTLCNISENPLFRDDAIKAIAGLGPAAEPALEILCKALHDKDWVIRVHAIEALGNLGVAAAPALDDLLKIIRHRHTRLLDILRDNPQYMMRKEAIIALGKMWPKSARAFDDIQKSLLQDEQASVRATAAQVLGQLGKDAIPALDALYTALQDKADNRLSVSVPEKAAEALVTILATIEEAGI